MKEVIALTETTYYILLSVVKPNYGYGIIQKVEKMTENRVTLGAGTLYGAINNLIDKKWIELYSEEKDSRKKKEYIITNKGREILKYEIKRMEELVENGKREVNSND